MKNLAKNIKSASLIVSAIAVLGAGFLSQAVNASGHSALDCMEADENQYLSPRVRWILICRDA